MRSERRCRGAGPAVACLSAALMLAPLAPAGTAVWARQEAGRPEGVRPGPGEDESMREDIQETVEIYMVARMKRFLNLTPDQERVVIPIVEDLNDSRRAMNRNHRLILMKLRPLVEDPAATDREMSALVRQLDDMDRQFRDKEIKARDQIRAVLSPRQQAQFVIFHDRFRQEMEERLRRIQQGEGPGGGPLRGPGGPRGNPPPPGWPRQR